MGAFVPKTVTPEVWDQMVPQNVYAIKMPLGQPARLRFGGGLGVYIEISKASNGHVVNILDFETGGPTLVGKLEPDTQAVIGRGSDSQIKIAQPVMSRQHVELKVWVENVLVAKDLSSTNGTFIWNEAPLINLTGLSDDVELSSELEKKFGIDMTPLLNEHSQSKGS